MIVDPVRLEIACRACANTLWRTLGLGSTPVHLRDAPFSWAPRDGEKVLLRPEHRLPGMPDAAYAVKEIVDVRPHAMHTLQAPNGQLFKWFATPELMPLSQEDSMNAIDQALKTTDTAKAVKALRADDLTSYFREHNIGGCNDHEPEPVVSLSAQPRESFDDLVAAIQRDRGISLREAIRQAGLARPDLAASR